MNEYLVTGGLGFIGSHLVEELLKDEENRVWYVGVTRTKQNLYIMSAKKEENGYDIESLG